MDADAYRGDGLTARVIQCIIRVHQTLGPGFLESFYRRALLIELNNQHLAVEAEKHVLVYYDGHVIGVRSYLKAARLDVALLVNFSDDRADFRRVKG